MKKLLLSALALLTMAGSGFAQNLPSYVPANGLVGWWPFNGNANDESGNNNNGTVNGATLTNDRFGNAGKAYGFDGIDDFIQTPVSSTNNYAISIWINPSQISQMHIIGNDDEQSSGKALILNSLGGIEIYNCHPVPTPNCYGIPGINALQNLINANNWYNIIASVNNGNANFYINGSLVGEGSGVELFGINWKIGAKGNLFTQIPFHGKLDDIAIYNRALTQQEITALYQGGNTTASCLDLPSNLQQGLVGYWPFCGNANDESGNGNNGTVNGATLTADRFGNAGSAYSFDGVDDIINTSFSGINGRKSRTISFWYNPGSLETGNSKTMIGYGETSSGDQCGKRFDCTLFQNGGPSIDLAYSYVTYNYPNTIGNWHHYIVSYDSTLGFSPTNIKMYIDGVIQTNILSSSLTCEINTGNLVPVSFGGPYLVTTGHNFNGSLDDIAIWNRALSQSEIAQLYNQGICKTSITVTDTLLIHTGITSYNPVAYQNTVKVWPNPSGQDITLDAGNLASMQGWKYKVANGLGQMVVNETAISQQQSTISLSTWGGNGIYYLHLINPQGIAIEIKKIVLAP